MLVLQSSPHIAIVPAGQVSEAFGLPYAGVAMKEAAAKWPVLAGMGKCDGEMCQVCCYDTPYAIYCCLLRS